MYMIYCYMYNRGGLVQIWRWSVHRVAYERWVHRFDDAGFRARDAQGFDLAGVQLERNPFQVEDDVGGILDHARQRAELVLGAFDAHGGDGGALDRTHEHAAQADADCVAESALERRRRKLAEPLGEGFGVGDGPLWLLIRSGQH